MKWSLALFCVGFFFTTISALEGYQAKCTIEKGSGFIVDSCDATKFLECKNNRCLCNDPGNQIYSFRIEAKSGKSRTKRGLKLKKKHVAIGLGAGAVGYMAGQHIEHQHHVHQDHHPEGRNGDKKSNKGEKVFSCYGRVGSPCILNYNNVVKVASIEIINTTSTPILLQKTMEQDMKKIPKCVENAVCIKSSKLFSIEGKQGTDKDPRIGSCACAEGFKATKTDECQKSNAAKSSYCLPASLLIIFSIIKIIYC